MNSRLQNWSDIRVFLAVFRAGSTLGASKALDMAQPTVARRIDALEHMLGLRLFDRDTRGFHPTAEAEELLAEAKAFETAAAAFETRLGHLKNRKPGAIRITAISEAFSESFSAILGDYCARNPDVAFEFLPGTRVFDLAAGEADIAIRHTNRIEDETLICRKVSEATSSLYGSKAYLDKHGFPTSPEDLAGHRIILFESNIMSAFSKWILDRIDPAQVVMKCNDLHGMLVAIRAGIGLGPMGSGIGDLDPTLMRCFPPPPDIVSTTWLLISPQAHKQPQVRAFCDDFAPRYSAMLKEQRRQREAKYAAAAPSP